MVACGDAHKAAPTAPSAAAGGRAEPGHSVRLMVASVEGMHTEVITYTRQTLGYAAPELAIAPETGRGALGGGALASDA